jgi:radical SAM protein with 4Fe4S-binding SPASM domain
VVVGRAEVNKLPIVQADAHAFALAQRNFDALPPPSRERWTAVFVRTRPDSELVYPERLILELAHTCNLDCPMCRVGELGVDLARVMPLDLFQRLATEIFPHVSEVRLNGLGETTLIPQLGRYLDILERYDLSVEMITNATGPLATYERLLAHDTTLLLSWDAATPDIFERVRRPAKWDVMLRALHEIGRVASVLGRSARLHLLYTLQPGTAGELPGIVEIAHRAGVPSVLVNVAKLSSDAWIVKVKAEALASFEAAEAAALRLGVVLCLPDHLGDQVLRGASVMSTPRNSCDRPWKEVVVRWDGAVQVCNMFNPYTYGHLDIGSFEQAWRGSFASVFREMIHTDRAHPYCHNCYYMKDVHARIGGGTG